MNAPNQKWPPEAPRSLPAQHDRLIRSDQERSKIADSLPLRVVTPIFGGGPVPRKVDRVEVIRAASIRGHLRFWWRALHAQNYSDSKSLYKAETELWGGPTTSDRGGRSPVELRVDLIRRPSDDKIDRNNPKAPGEHATGYALFPAREEKEDKKKNKPYKPPGERYQSDVDFNLTISAPADKATQVCDALRAWLLFGGYGGRTRRGLGSLSITDVRAREQWLPKGATKEAIKQIFGRDIFAVPAPGTFVPVLAGAELFDNSPASSAEIAWTTAIAWLRDFRQGSEGPDAARERSSDRFRPGRSRWPEADKVRHLSKKSDRLKWAHLPQHNETPAWPRAVLGLPIIGRFQDKNRQGKRWQDLEPPMTEPGGFELGWRDAEGIHRDRLASPLIVKALPLADGKFAPIALWLARADPPGDVVLKANGDLRVPAAQTAASFDRLHATGDTPQLTILGKHKTLREVFFAWLKAQPRSSPSQSSTPRPNGPGNRTRSGHRR